MKRKKITFNYENLSSLDMVVCAGRGPMATATRIVTAGWKNAFNHGIAVHTGMIFVIEGQRLVAEMQGRGLVLQSLERYNRIGGRRWVIGIKRHQAYSSATARKIAQEQMALDLRRRLGYDVKGLFEFVSKRVKDNPKRAYCSEYYYQITAKNVGYPMSFGKKVSPFDLQTCAGFYPVGNWGKVD